MLRGLLTGASALSLLLCAAIAVLGVRSYWRAVLVSREGFDSNALVITSSSVWIADGRLQVCSRRMAFESRLAYAQFAPQSLLRFDFSTPLPRGGLKAPRGHLGVSSDSIRFGYEFPWNSPGPPNASHYDPQLGTGKYLHVIRLTIVPIAYVALLLFALGLPAIHQIRRRLSRKPPGHCIRCGYDLRASTDRCPECGTPIATAAAQIEDQSGALRALPGDRCRLRRGRTSGRSAS